MTIEVTDHSPQLAVLRQVHQTDIRGRGLILVDTLAGDWGWRPFGDGKAVWFTLQLDSPTAGGL